MSTTPARRGRQPAAQAIFAGLVAVSWWFDHRAPAAEPSTPGPAGQAFVMREVAAGSGLVFRHQAPQLDPRLEGIEAQIAALGAAVSVSDVDGDGLPDVYVTSSRFGAPNALFHNQGQGRFRDVAAAAGVADLNVEGRGASMGSCWADMDNDGDEDLFVYRWGYPALLRNDGALHFTDVTAGSGLERWVNCNAAIWFDADQDGLVDLYVAGYFHQEHDLWNLKSTLIMHDDFEFATNGGDNWFFRNLGGGRFLESTAAAGLTSTRWTMGAAAADFDDDGWIDLYTANDYGAEEFYRNRGDGSFELVDAGLGDDSKSGMCVALGEIQNEGRLAVYVTNISERAYLFQGNNLRLNYLDDGSGFLNIAEGPIADCGWAWGSQFGDFDNDGWQDLFVANGFVTGEPGKGSYWYSMSKVAGATGGVVRDAANWPPMNGADLSGGERSRVLMNKNGRVFRDMAEALGVNDAFDGRAVALADLAGRGALDVLVANQRGPLLAWRCEPPAGRHWVQFVLVARHSNRSAIGASVAVKAGPLHGLRVVDGGSGFSSQNERKLHFGLGEQAVLDEVVVRWPDGRRQVLPGAGLAVDRVHTIEEPER